jgi:hydroxyethylthiazole kinase-like uncharacterized protein yjeF
MTELLTAAQMSSIEAAAIASGQVTGLELMERAGRGVVEAVFEEWPELRTTSHRAVVLCGPGNNGGDGFVVARLLKEWGWEVEVFLYGSAVKMPPDARANYERWLAIGETKPMPSVNWQTFSEKDLLVDAVFGSGLARNLPKEVEKALAQPSLLRIVAIDILTGVDSDSGNFLASPDVSRDTGSDFWTRKNRRLTVTFHSAKVGHYLGDHALDGRLVVKSIGLEARSEHQAFGPNEFAAYLTHDFGPFFQKRSSSHKYSHGHALILSGPPGRCGAARLAARGALRIGAGVVTLGCPPEALAENAARLDAIMVRPWGSAEGLAAALGDERINAVCVGPGLGLDAYGEQMLRAVLQDQYRAKPKAIVLDADALTLLSRAPGLFGILHERCVLTPHAGEFARLFPDIAARLSAPATTGPAYSKVDATREAAARAGCVVLFKGPDTVIASPDGTCAINSAHYDRAAPWLATAGSGDVLAGFITGLLARGFGAHQAAEAASWLHVECARSFGPGLIAEDLPEELPKVFRSLGL